MGFMKIHLHIIKWREVIWCGQPKLDWMKEVGGVGGGEEKKRQMEELVIKQQCFIVRQPIHLIWL